MATAHSAAGHQYFRAVFNVDPVMGCSRQPRPRDGRKRRDESACPSLHYSIL